ncbi:hypothetical protein V1498_05045 [Peribacillus sp. SCS-26]|uniref:hypothetical protein n=1 Tax=Paraperibacillus marinus TaxID=3115295 RepID=UPI003906535E
MEEYFLFNERLGIPVPRHGLASLELPGEVMLKWEQIRGGIPDRIRELEGQIVMKQKCLFRETDFDRSCILNTEISELASVINDLWLWFRDEDALFGKSHS